LIVVFGIWLNLIYAQDTKITDNYSTEFEATGNEKSPTEDGQPNGDEEKISGNAFFGGITIGGENYQQLGLRLDLPIWKFGLGLDIQLYMNNQGQIRKEEWDEFEDYLDKIYYLRFGHKGDPFYVKVGGLDFTTLGYGNIVNGYSNMIEYPAYKRQGMELALQGDRIGFEMFFNNYKELLADKPSVLIGGRGTYRLFGKLTAGLSLATDLNEYNGLRDKDDDGFPDLIDAYPEDSKFATDFDKRISEANYDTAFVEQVIATFPGLIDPTRREELFNLRNNTSTSAVVGVDLGMPIINLSAFKLDIFTQFTHIIDYGWGATLPGLRMSVGQNQFMVLTAEYRRSSDKFLYGYYGHAYEMERAQFVAGRTLPLTKKQSLDKIESAMNGFFVGLSFNIANFVVINAGYQDLMNEEMHRRTLNGELAVKEGLIPIISTAKAYYFQDNVENFKEWKTPSTMMGYIVGYNMKGVNIGFDYRFSFQDKDGDGLIRGSEETIKSIGLRAGMTF